MIDRISSLLRYQKPIISDRGLLFGSGATVPTDGTDGWQTGAIFQHTDGSTGNTLYVNEGSVTSSDFNVIGANIDGPLYLDKTSTLRIGDWVAAGATTGGVPLTNDYDTYGDGQIDIMQVHGVSTTSVGSDHSAKCGRFRHLVNMSGTIETETYGLIGQLVAKTATLGHYHAGLMGTVESSGGFTVGNTLACTAAVAGRPGGASITISSGCTLAALAAISNTTSATITGKYVGVYIAKAASGNDAFSAGIWNKAGSVTADIKVQAEDANSLPCMIFSGSATNDAGIVSQVGADTLWADGSLYISVVDGAGKLFQKQNDVWVDLQA